MDGVILSSYFSLIIQIITGMFSVNGLFFNLDEKDFILHQALQLETFVQVIEFLFYIFLIYRLKISDLNNDNITSTRYFDWFITTPTMLVSTILYLKYQENKENNKNKNLNFIQILKDEKSHIIQILISNWLMLLFGYLGEIGILDKNISIGIGFIFFANTFNILHCNYAAKSKSGLKIYYFMFIVWSLYGVVAGLDFREKNISYNVLDVVSKNFYGLFLYFLIKSKSKSKSNLNQNLNQNQNQNQNLNLNKI